MIRSEIALPIVTTLLVGVGLLTLSTAAPADEFTRQIAFLGFALLACGVVFWLGRRHVVRAAGPIYLLSLALLVVTQFFGTEVNGAKSWLYLGPLPGFQPSELAKIAVILSLAIVLHERPLRGLGAYFWSALLVGLPFGLVFIEPDLGSALVIAAVGGGVLLVRGVPRLHLLFFLLVFVIAVPTVVWPNLEPHQKTRLTSFMNPAADPKGSGYQVIQSRIAIGSGGLLGKGYKRGTQTQYGFIPYRQTDFILAPLAEEGGFVAAAGLLVLYGLLFWRLVAMAVECPLERDQLLIVGVVSLIGFQVVVNVGVTLGLAPVTGITLPLVSYGGTSLLSTLVALSIAFVVHRDRYADW